MRRILIVLSYVIFISYLNGASFQLPASMDSDAIELADLMEKFWSSKPAEYNKIEPLIYCKVIDTCCEGKQHEEISLAFSTFFDDRNDLLEIVGSCVNSTEQNGGNKWCQTYTQEIISLWDLHSNSQAAQFGQLMIKLDEKLGRFGGDVPEFCDDEEGFAFMCLSNKKLVQRCAYKRLQYLIKRFGYNSINGASLQLSTSIDSDAVELSNLVEKFWSSKPAEINKVQPFIYCKVLDTCCEEKQRQEAIPLFFTASFDIDDRNRFLETVGSCVNSTEQNGGDKWCQTYSQEMISPWNLRSNPQAVQFKQVMMKLLEKLENIDPNAPDICDDEEKYAFMCLTNKKLTQRCVHKMLKDLIKRLGYKSFEELVMKYKQALIDINQEWSTISIKNGETN
ncbi:unnamed protein product [Adineta steineri]|uniref:Uncharacterized protein n=2 Tax=Adineta steineri TaxID=433720 RepID=A0A815KKL1_9BILA|nr:unnamed protein product [Adineta steineri]CAF3652343.1 unnamed protein product [Adineta steineri]